MSKNYNKISKTLHEYLGNLNSLRLRRGKMFYERANSLFYWIMKPQYNGIRLGELFQFSDLTEK